MSLSLSARWTSSNRIMFGWSPKCCKNMISRKVLWASVWFRKASIRTHKKRTQTESWALKSNLTLWDGQSVTNPSPPLPETMSATTKLSRYNPIAPSVTVTWTKKRPQLSPRNTFLNILSLSYLYFCWDGGGGGITKYFLDGHDAAGLLVQCLPDDPVRLHSWKQKRQVNK